LAFDEKTANAADKAGVLEIVDTSLVKHIIKQHIVPVPVFIKKFYAGMLVFGRVAHTGVRVLTLHRLNVRIRSDQRVKLSSRDRAGASLLAVGVLLSQ